MLNKRFLRFRPKEWKGVCIFLCIFLLIDFQSVVFAGQSQQATTSGSPAREAVSIENARVLLLVGNINSAITEYALLLSKDSANVVLSSEYAYALALNGIYDAALVRLDRIWSQKAGNTEVNYFTSQIFALMGYDQLAGEFWKESDKNSPSWISAKSHELLLKSKREPLKPAAPGREELVMLFKHANRMTAQNFIVQSIASFEEIINQYPNEYLPYVGYSIALEKAGLLERSAQIITSALQIVGDNPDQKDTKQFLDQRLVSVRNKITQGQKPGPALSSSDVNGDNGPHLIAYAGGFVAKSFTSLNARFGNYLSKSSYASADLGLTSAAGNTYVNVGVSVYNRQGIFVEGFGLTAALGSTAAIFGKISVGLSFMNKNRTSSLDIFLDGRMPLTKGGVTTVGLSVGQSIYFGKRK